MTKTDPIAGVVVFVFALAIFLMAGSYAPEAAMFPRAVAAIMMICAVILFVRGLSRPAEAQAEPLAGPQAARLGLSVVLTVVYVAAIVPLGFATSSLIYIPAAAYAMGLRRHVMIWVTTIVFVLLIYLLFVRIFYTPLPRELILQLF